MGALDSAAYLDHQTSLHGGQTPIQSGTSAAFKAALVRAKAARTGIPGNSTLVLPSPRLITLGPGIHAADEALAFLGAEGLTSQTRGLHFQGAGSGQTIVEFTAAQAAIMAKSTYWQNVRFTGITFLCADSAAGSTFLQVSNANASAGQDYIFTDCVWHGPWKYGIQLTGDNNASEFRFIACGTSHLQDSGAFLFADSTGSDQFLNYWFYGFKHWTTSAPVIDMTKGGSVHIYGLDASDWGASNTGVLFALRGHTHAYGVTQFHAQGVRVENKSTSSKILYSEWDDGNVELQVDMSSQVGSYTYGTMIDLQLGNANGATYHIHDSRMAGKIAISTGTGSWTHSHQITIEDSTWLQAQRPTDVVTYSTSGMDLGAEVRFIRCRPNGYSDLLEAQGWSTWDAIVGWNRVQMASSQVKRSLRLTAPWGGITASDTATIHLPVGAMVTGFRALAPVQSSADTDGGTVTLSTTEATPTTIATATITGSTATGYSVGGDLATPVLLDTAARATVKVTASGLTATPHDAAVIIEGYW